MFAEVNLLDTKLASVFQEIFVLFFYDMFWSGDEGRQKRTSCSKGRPVRVRAPLQWPFTELSKAHFQQATFALLRVFICMQVVFDLCSVCVYWLFNLVIYSYSVLREIFTSEQYTVMRTVALTTFFMLPIYTTLLLHKNILADGDTYRNTHTHTHACRPRASPFGNMVRETPAEPKG